MSDAGRAAGVGSDGGESAASADINAFVTRERIEGGDDGPLSGKTVAVKDNISTAGVRTTCGSEMLADYVPPYDATVVERLREAGATIVGKTNMDEFGMGTTTETSAFGPTRNPVDPERVPGGSSGGSAAAVAAGEADLALGSDTGGSVRCPASFCGVVGIKPTYGLVSRYGLVAYANSLEQIGPIAPTVADAAALLDVIAGPDDRDATTGFDEHPATDADYAAAAEAGTAHDALSDVTIGVPSELLADVHDGVRKTVEAAIDGPVERGAERVGIELPSIEPSLAAYYVIAMAEASSNLARFDGVRYGAAEGGDGDWNERFGRTRAAGFGDEVKRRILLGTFALSAGYHDQYYEQAQAARNWVRQDFDEAFESVDVIASPTMPVPPFELGDRMDDPLDLYLADANTVPANLANLPAISVPAGETDGLPVGLQLIGPAFGEERIIRVASAVER
jgi:aspartyl-tRNA(Asn)/glutamyl-tRNA(Gln) amidotransferase subunit A